MLSLEIALVYLLTTLSACVVLYVWRYNHYFFCGFKLPGLSKTETIRYLISFIGSSETVTKRFIKVYAIESSKSDKPTIRMWFGPRLLVLLTDPDLIQKVYQSHLQKDSVYHKLLGTIMENRSSIFMENDIDKWRTHRRIITHASFTLRVLKSNIETFFQESKVLADKMETFAETGEAFEPGDLLFVANFSNTLRTQCGLDEKVQQTFRHQHLVTKAIDDIMSNVSERFLKPFLLLDIFYTLFGYKKRILDILQGVEMYVNTIVSKVKLNIIRQQRAENKSAAYAQQSFQTGCQQGILSQQPLQFAATTSNKQPSATISNNENNVTNNKEENARTFEDDLKPPQSFVEVVLRRQMDPRTPDGVMSQEDLVGQILTLFMAGSDTTRFMNTIILLLLALHPTIQQKVYDEIQTVLGSDPDIPPTYDQLAQLHTLTRVIKESLRLYPAAPIVGRYADEDIEFDGYTIPKGAGMFVFILGVHRDPRYWSNPNQFNPDRFLPSEVTKHHPNAYLPFSTGPRNCVGYKYAMLSMKVTTSTILRRYKLLPGVKCKSVEDIRFNFGVTLQPLPGNDIRLERRLN